MAVKGIDLSGGLESPTVIVERIIQNVDVLTEIKAGEVDTPATAEMVGTMRYREYQVSPLSVLQENGLTHTGTYNVSNIEVCVRTGASTYAWIPLWGGGLWPA